MSWSTEVTEKDEAIAENDKDREEKLEHHKGREKNGEQEHFYELILDASTESPKTDDIIKKGPHKEELGKIQKHRMIT